jgi:hypothetical protein
MRPHLARAIHLEVLGEDAGDLRLQRHVPLCPGRQLRRVATRGGMRVIGGRGDRQHLADRLDPVRFALIVDERDHGLNRRSSSVPSPDRRMHAFAERAAK